MEKVLCISNLSGGIDSFATTYKALENGYDVFIVNFQYGQLNFIEEYAADRLVNYLREKFGNKVIGYRKINLDTLLDNFTSIYKQLRDNDKIKNITQTKFYTPSRNLLFSIISTVIGEIIALNSDYQKVLIALGIHTHSDNVYRNQYWDTTTEFVDKLNDLLMLNNAVKILTFTPFVGRSKSDVFRYVIIRNLPYKLTWTCYSPVVSTDTYSIIYKPCLECESCKEREAVGKQLGINDINDYSIQIFDDTLDEEIDEYFTNDYNSYEC